jgi:CO/xanthine dehydrogenase Mo-binding subunit
MVDRREFLMASVQGGLALALAPVSASAGADAPELSPWITLHPDGTVTLVTTSFEMGQGSRTGQAQILADELDVPWSAVRTVQATEREPYLRDGALYSGGSSTVSSRYERLRRAGAAVRAQLVAAAAQAWKVEPSACTARDGVVRHAGSGRHASYGSLAAAAARIVLPEPPALKPASERRYIGQSLPTLDQSDKVNGRARYGIDFRLPGMKFATLVQCPYFGGALEALDEGPARAMAGVRAVLRFKDAVAVVADTTWQAFQAAAQLQPRWAVQKRVADSQDISRMLAANIDAPTAVVSPVKDGAGAAARGRLRAAYAAAARKHEASYEISYLAHATMEPMNATARPLPGGVEIWAPYQSPTFVRDEAAAICGVPKDKIVLHPLLMGGGFGRRLKGDYAGRAAQVALAYGDAVQVVWTREEDISHDFYRPAMRATLRAALPADGTITGYEVLAATADDTTGGFRPAPYVLRDYAATLANVKVGVPIGAWRSVDTGMATFAKECFIDECAHASGVAPLACRRVLLAGNARALRVLDACAAAIGSGPGVGFAMMDDWDTLVAHAVQVEVKDGRVRVVRIVAAVDCGTAVNPQQVRAQFEGGALMALSAATGEKITLVHGRVAQRNFSDYPLLRMADAPQVDVVLLSSPDAPVGGVGEPPVPGIAPALANAVFAATGRRLRSLPMALDAAAA